MIKSSQSSEFKLKLCICGVEYKAGYALHNHNDDLALCLYAHTCVVQARTALCVCVCANNDHLSQSHTHAHMTYHFLYLKFYFHQTKRWNVCVRVCDERITDTRLVNTTKTHAIRTFKL
jgi:hypothetical protein